MKDQKRKKKKPQKWFKENKGHGWKKKVQKNQDHDLDLVPDQVQGLDRVQGLDKGQDLDHVQDLDKGQDLDRVQDLDKDHHLHLDNYQEQGKEGKKYILLKNQEITV